MIQYGQYPDPGHVVAHLSDPHLLAGGVRQYGAVDTEARLRAALGRLSHLTPAPQALVFTGDLADKAEPAAYALLREIVEPLAADLGAEVVWTMGNHDERAEYAAGLFDEDGGDGGDGAGPQDRVHDVGGLRIIALDTSVPGFHHGELTGDQLVWLAEELATPAPHGTLLAMHHAPIPVPMTPAAGIIELLDQDLLATTIAGTDVRGILGGHFHFSSYSTFAGVPVSVASATCYTSDPAPEGRFISGVDGHQSLTMLHVYADRIVHSIVPVAAAPEVSGFPSDVSAQVEALSADERRDLLSRKDSPFYVTDAGKVIE
ncbi:metallophosphoesterase [Nocardioides sp. LHG3406-4]|uniref:metallophosphoesterase n=1 Tax=Nocardioides sp. LHG3406-4 TaxID=2804575 RepID=UPI003CEB5579